jgi:hypothetical protein
MIDMFERFPDMKPITWVPPRFRINGIGTKLFGSRDHDRETGTYVMTLWLTFAFFPCLPLGAYRVADAPGGGWNFLGKVPVSGRAKLMPLAAMALGALFAGIMTLIVYFAYPERMAAGNLQQAEQLRKEGKLTAAANTYREVAVGRTMHRTAAMKALTDMLDDPQLQESGDATEMAGVFRAAYDTRNLPGAVRNLFNRGKRFAAARQEKDPEGSLAVLEAVEPAAPKPEDVLPLKEKMLERLTASRPDDAELRDKLAAVRAAMQMPP